jgi:4-hydroxybenzoate polyprenyltransferase
MEPSATKQAGTVFGRPSIAGLKIVAAAVAFRIRKLEMANLAAATSIAMALHLPFTEVVFRTLFAFVLNALVYLNNDYLDVADDLQSTNKDATKTKFLAEHMDSALAAQWGLGILLAVGALLYDPGMLAPLIFGGGVCIWYSIDLKRRPFTDIPAMAVWGVAMPACGFPWHSALGWCMAIQLGLFSGVFESIQVMRDADEDAAEGVRTTGVVLGKAKTLLLARVLMVACSGYAALVLHPIAAVISAAALVVPFDPNRIARYWTLVKLIYGITWLFICGWVYFARHGSGLVWTIDALAR